MQKIELQFEATLIRFQWAIVADEESDKSNLREGGLSWFTVPEGTQSTTAGKVAEA